MKHFTAILTSIFFLFIVPFIFFACTTDDPVSIDENGIKDQDLQGNLKGGSWFASQAFVRKDTNSFNGGYNNSIWIYENHPSTSFRNPCYEYNSFDSARWNAKGSLPAVVGSADVEFFNSGYYLNFIFNSWNYYENILLTGKVNIESIDNTSRIMKLGLAVNSGEDELNGKIDCEICLSKGEYLFKNQTMKGSIMGNEINPINGVVFHYPGLTRPLFFYLTESTLSNVCNESEIQSSNYILFKTKFEEKLTFLWSSKAGSPETIPVQYIDVNNSKSWLGTWGAVEIINADTANGFITVKMDARGDQGFNMNGTYTFSYCN